ncbi:MAG TPA: tRNA (adenosine(37)-N6)-threonylcarbamoyltransferase complex dimerization subunit type 1 TsaB [Streptosporangiaceae bacterium]|nr:tRNA (adenosine(37)-N6)-threonylcarbamoyltransferase complex dimerization subunit type 1 TsaB [Streptosporangiaceae bacterium]
MLLLAFDTATPAVTVALHDGSRVVAEESAVDARRHGELLAVAIEKVLRSAGATERELTSIAVGTGPGPYTGLRAGLVTATVLASALGIPADGICTLDVLAAAAAAAADGDFLVATDARRREVYWARYDRNGQRLDGPYVGKPAELPAGLPVAGEGAALYPELAAHVLQPRYPSAAQLAALAASRQAAGEPPARPEPLYLRRPDAREPGPPKRVTEPRPAAGRTR